jgi:protein-L-isoaspartate O-methyltransferase
LTSQAAGALLDAAQVGGGAAVLHVASGPGYAAARAAARGADVTAVDVLPEMVELAASLNPGVRFEVGEAGTRPFGDASFDAVVANFLMPTSPTCRASSPSLRASDPARRDCT